MNKPLIPKVARRYTRIGSTNDTAVAALSAGEDLPHGAVLLTDEQTAGRGQATNRWHATPGDNLTLSLVLYPDHLTADRLFALTQWTSLALARTVAHFLPDADAATVRIKWPNDLYVGDQKIAGILVQNGLRGSRVAWSVIGVGLNVNERDFPPPLGVSARALHLPPGPKLDLETVLDVLLQQFAATYELTDPARRRDLDQAYHRLLYRRNQTGRYELAQTGERFSAVLRGVDPDGRLRLQRPAGPEQRFALREIRFV